MSKIVECPSCGENLLKVGVIEYQRCWVGYYANPNEYGELEYEGTRTDPEVGDASYCSYECRNCGTEIADGTLAFEAIFKEKWSAQWKPT